MTNTGPKSPTKVKTAGRPKKIKDPSSIAANSSAGIEPGE